MAAFRKLVPLLDRVLVEKLSPATKSVGGVLLPESALSSQLNAGKVVAVGAGGCSKDGDTIPVCVKEGDVVLLPEYRGTEVKLEEKEYVLIQDDDIIGIIQE